MASFLHRPLYLYVCINTNIFDPKLNTFLKLWKFFSDRLGKIQYRFYCPLEVVWVKIRRMHVLSSSPACVVLTTRMLDFIKEQNWIMGAWMHCRCEREGPVEEGTVSNRVYYNRNICCGLVTNCAVWASGRRIRRRLNDAQ